MKSYYWFILSCLVLVGCVASNGLQYEAVSETNLYHLARVRKGMSERQVLFIMHKPYNYESFHVGDDIYDVWFYVTRMTGLDQTRMVPQNLTPLTFKNGVLVGTGYPWYYFAMKEYANEVAAENPPPPRPKSQDEEDTEFEKALRSYPPAQPAQPPAPSQPATAPQAKPLSMATLRLQGPVVASIHQNKLKFISEGMSEAEVTTLLGVPSHYKSFEMNDDVYDVWFYDISPLKKNEQPWTLPLTFKNSVLVGMTADYYASLKEAAREQQVDGYDQDIDRMQEEESEQNFNFW